MSRSSSLPHAARVSGALPLESAVENHLVFYADAIFQVEAALGVAFDDGSRAANTTALDLIALASIGTSADRWARIDTVLIAKAALLSIDEYVLDAEIRETLFRGGTRVTCRAMRDSPTKPALAGAARNTLIILGAIAPTGAGVGAVGVQDVVSRGMTESGSAWFDTEFAESGTLEVIPEQFR